MKSYRENAGSDPASPSAAGPGAPRKPSLALRLRALLLVWLCAAALQIAAQAQGVIHTGIIDRVTLSNSSFRLRCDQIGGRPLTFFNMDSVNFLTVSGMLLTLEDLQPGTPATIVYVISGNRWVILKVLLPDPVLIEPDPANCYRGYDRLPPYRVTGQYGLWEHGGYYQYGS